MLIYHPAFDIYHCIFRVIRLLLVLKKDQYPVELIRILDFYLLFPSELLAFRFPSNLRKQKSLFSNLENRYDKLYDPRHFFIRLESYQIAAFNYLASRSLISASALSEGNIVRTLVELPVEFNSIAEEANQLSPDLIDFLVNQLALIDLYGEKGLKSRTNLLEYHYDSV